MRYLVWALGRLGYMVRPYDMLADKRRWFWQPRQPCQYMTDEQALKGIGMPGCYNSPDEDTRIRERLRGRGFPL